MTRLELQSLLEETLGSENVYFQPPEGLRMKFPAIVYHRMRIDNDSADNVVYKQSVYYQIEVIDPNPDSEIVFRVSKIPKVKHDRHFTTSGLNHDVFTINC